MKKFVLSLVALLMPPALLAHVDKEHEVAAQVAYVQYACPGATAVSSVEPHKVKDALLEYVATHTSPWPSATPHLYLGKPYASGCIAGFVLDGNMNLETISFEEWEALDPLASDGMEFHVRRWRFLPETILYTEARTHGEVWEIAHFYEPIVSSANTELRLRQAWALFERVLKEER